MKDQVVRMALLALLLVSGVLSGAAPALAQDSGDEAGPSTTLLPFVNVSIAPEDGQYGPESPPDIWDGVEWIQDCVTGNNQFYNEGKDGVQWYINQENEYVPGQQFCDNYWNETYERPVRQVFASINLDEKPPYSAFVPEDPTFLSGFAPDGEFIVGDTVYATDSGPYSEYVDITRARYTADDEWLLFQIELFGRHVVNSDGARTGAFAGGAVYTIRLGNNPDSEGGASGANTPNGGILLSNNLRSSIRPWWLTGWGAVRVFRDRNGDAGGVGGVNVARDGTEQTPGGPPNDSPGDGYEVDMGNRWWLFARHTTSEVDGVTRPVIEIAFNYARYNELTWGPDFTPEGITFVQFDATRGLTDNESYFWNDYFTLAQIGSPYPAAPAQTCGEGAVGSECYIPKPKPPIQVDTLRSPDSGSEKPDLSMTKYVSIYAEAVQPEFYDANNSEVDTTDPQSALGVSIHYKVIWRYVATNTGNTDLYNVAVLDDFEGAPDICFDVPVPNVLAPPYDHIVFYAHPELWGEDPGFNLPITLAPGAVLDCFAWTGDGPADPPEVGGELGDSYMNTGTVTANTTPDTASPTVDASDVSWYVVNSTEQ